MMIDIVLRGLLRWIIDAMFLYLALELYRAGHVALASVAAIPVVRPWKETTWSR